MAEILNTDVGIVGGGLSGLTLSCLLATHGLKVVCLDQADPKAQIKADERTTAVSYGSQKVLEEAGIWQYARDQACPIQDIQILDGHSSVLLNFLSSEVGDKDFGWIMENAVLREACLKRVSELPNIQHIAPAAAQNFETDEDHARITLAPNAEGLKTIEAQLLIGADGRRSAVRDWMGVDTRAFDYGQRAIVCIVTHENPHNNAAVEHFWPQGPFAVLPMTDDKEGRHRSSIVFTEHGPKSESKMHYSDEAFMAALQLKFPDSYGAVEIISKRLCFPLNLIHAASYIGPRCALVADAAHGIHPIAGQGLNLGFRDVKALSDLLSRAKEQGKDLGNPELLRTYQRRRRPDNMAMVAVTDGLVRLFSNNIAPVRIVRGLGLRAVSKIPLAKRFFMKQAMADRG